MRIFQAGAGPMARVDANYLTAWGFKDDAFQLGPKEPSFMCDLNSSATLEPQLVIQAFSVGQNLTLVHGNLVIRKPAKVKVTVTTKKRVLLDAMRKLEQQAKRHSSSATQPAVIVLVGDPNLVKEEAEAAIQTLQPDDGAHWQNVWQVHATSTQLSGDIALVKGAHVMPFDLPFGPSHRHPGVRKDQHDAIGLELQFLSGVRSGAPQPTASAHNDTRGCSPQPATKRSRTSHQQGA